MSEPKLPSIVPSVGDVLEMGIMAHGGYIVQRGMVIIHKSRLRRAQRFGWKRSTVPIGFPLPEDAVCVERR